MALLWRQKFLGIKIETTPGTDSIPTVAANAITPHAEAFQAVIWHCLVTHPAVLMQENKWEGLEAKKA